MENQTQIELLSSIEKQLESLTSSVWLLKESIQKQQPSHSQSDQLISSSSRNDQIIENGSALNGLNGRKGKRNSVPETEAEPKAKQRCRHSMNVNFHQDQDQVVEVSPMSKSIRSKRATRNRHSNTRKTVAFDSAAEMKAIADVTVRPNTDPNVYATNNLYRMLCLYCCTTERFLVRHYMKQHPQYEVPIARLSPVMAARLRAQSEQFEMDMGKIEGFCLFCEKTKKMPKHHWTAHLLQHTGELMFFCDGCNMKLEHKNGHKKCGRHALNVFIKNSTDASLIGYMCKDCNYVQIHLSAIEKHLTNEHGFESVHESQYEKLTLIPDMSPLQSPVSSKYKFAEASQRFNCTICHKLFPGAEIFTQHLAEEHSEIDQYNCFCGEIVSKNAQFSGMEWIAAHLLMHRTDLFQCMICNGIYLRKSDVLKHISTTHIKRKFKYQHVCRRPNYDIKISECTVDQMKCNVCQQQMDGIVNDVFEHFQNEHQSQEIRAIGIATKKITNGPKTTYESGIQLNIKITKNT